MQLGQKQLQMLDLALPGDRVVPGSALVAHPQEECSDRGAPPLTCAEYRMNSQVLIPVRAKKVVQRISQVTPTAAAPRCAPAAANRCLPATSITGLASAKPCRSPLVATRSVRALTASRTNNPSPSYQRTLIRSPRRPRNTNTCPENGFCSSLVSTNALSPVKPRRKSVTPAAIQMRVLAGSAIIAADTPTARAAKRDQHCLRCEPGRGAVPREWCPASTSPTLRMGSTHDELLALAMANS